MADFRKHGGIISNENYSYLQALSLLVNPMFEGNVKLATFTCPGQTP